MIYPGLFIINCACIIKGLSENRLMCVPLVICWANINLSNFHMDVGHLLVYHFVSYLATYILYIHLP